MINWLTKGSVKNITVYEYCADSVDDIDLLPTTTTAGKGVYANDPDYVSLPSIGSTCMVNTDGGLLVYMLFSNGWKNIS